MQRIILTILAVTALSVLLVACSDDDPVTPDLDPQPLPVATTPDSLMSLYRTAMTNMDSDLLGALLGEDFTLVLNQWDPTIGSPPLPDNMTRRETILSVENMAGGGDVTNWQGNPIPGVTGITVQEWTFLSGWNYSPNSDLAASSIWYLKLTVDRGPDHPPLAVAGDYEVIVSGIEIEDQQVAWTLWRLDFRGRISTEEVSLMAAHLAYLTNEAPIARIDVTSTPGDTWPTYTFDPAASSDDDSGLPLMAYRWSTDEFPGGWSSWGGANPRSYTFVNGDEHEVTLEVRDRWGATAQVSVTVQPVRAPMPFPGSPDQLMANFKAAYEDRHFEDMRSILHRDFQMILQQETIDEFPDVGMTLDVNEELRIHQRMFSGDDLTDPVSGNLIPGMESVSFRIFNPRDTWQETPPGDRFPNAFWAPYDVDFMFSRGQQYSILKAEGVVRFYVTSRDSLHEGTMKQYYQMVGQWDLTGGFKAVETANYGSIKAIYR